MSVFGSETLQVNVFESKSWCLSFFSVILVDRCDMVSISNRNKLILDLHTRYAIWLFINLT